MHITKRPISILLATTSCALFAGVVVAQQASAADLILGSGLYTANTTALTLTGPSVNVHGTNVGGIAVFKFHTITVPDTATISAIGSRPFELSATGAIVINGIISANAENAVRGDATSGVGGAGGGGGGLRAGVPSSAHGAGPGGGVAGTVDAENGGGGGGFGAKGARGGTCADISDCAAESGHGGAAGQAYGDLSVKLQGGSGGGPGAVDARGGGGGGAIGLFGASVTIHTGALILANGGSGVTGTGGASGGGSGGGVLIHGNAVDLDGVIAADGGDGGAGGCCGDGGGGAGGRIAVQYRSLVSRFQNVVDMSGGVSGISGGFSHGGLSPDLRGVNGVATFTQIDASKLSISANKSITKGHTTATATKLTDAGTGAGLGGRTVTLWKKPKSGGSWAKIATKTTSSSGGASASVKPSSSTLYQWRFGGTLIHLKVNSSVETITVHS